MISLTELLEQVGVTPDIVSVCTSDGRILKTEPFLTHEQQSKLIRVLLNIGVEFAYNSRESKYVLTYENKEDCIVSCSSYLEDCLVDMCSRLVSRECIDSVKLKIILRDNC